MTPPMGRRRTRDRDLPPRMHRKHGAYWYKRGTAWTRLAPLDDRITAFARYADLESGGRGRRLQDGLNRYMAEHIPTLAPGSRRDYQSICVTLGRWGGHLPADQVTTAHVARLLDEYPHPARANKVAAVLSSVYSRMIRWGWVSTNPCRGVPRNRVQRRTALPSWSEIRALRAGLPERWQAMMDFALATALRLGDMLAVPRSADQSDGLHVTVSKTGNTVVYEWTPELREIVRRLKRGRIASLWLCPNTQGQRYTTGGFESVWQRHKKRAGNPAIRWHDLRARALTDAERAHGKDYAQALAAHASVTTTERYIRGRGEIVVQPVRASEL